jgi:hypothetical protein
LGSAICLKRTFFRAPSGLIWRALVLWLVLMLLLTLANWAP